MNDVIIYQTPDNQTEVEVRFTGDTVWLTQEQIAELFGTQRPAITKHLKNIFISGELNESVVSSILEHTTEHGAIPGKTQRKKVKYYNLDAIISIGYRVNSKEATVFRIWATRTLSLFLLNGYAINYNRLEQLRKTIHVISQGGNVENLQLPEAKGLLSIISQYTQSFVQLSQFDSSNLIADNLNENITYEISYADAKEAIQELKIDLKRRGEASSFFGNEKDDGFKSSLGNIIQTFETRICPNMISADSDR